MDLPSIGSILTVKDAMALAIRLAYLGANQVAPNPMVGCVVLDKSYKLLSYGYHQKYGEAHAEVNALKNINKEDLEGAHIFVTLEPCSHRGKTGPCSDLICSLPIESLTYGLKDPNPLVSGKGIEQIREAGIWVKEFAGPKEDLTDLLDSFLFHMDHQKECFFTLKVAASLDGMICDGFGQSQWITGEKARIHSHFLRTRFQALLVGKNTVKIDNPSLNARHEDFPDHKNKIVIFNPSADLLPEIKKYKLYEIRDPAEVVLVVDKTRMNERGKHHINNHLYLDEDSGVHVIALAYDNEFSFTSLQEELLNLGIYDVLIEGGSEVHSYFLKNRRFHRLYMYKALKILGSKEALSWTNQFKLPLDESISLDLMVQKNLDEDLFLQFCQK